MSKPELFDAIELLVELPEYNLRSGMRGAIVECYSDSDYEVEFSDSLRDSFASRNGETLALCALSTEQFIVVWKAKTQTWVSVSEQIAALIEHLPDEPRQEVLDFARFLCDRVQRRSATSAEIGLNR